MAGRGYRGEIRWLAPPQVAVRDPPQTMLVASHDMHMVAELFARTIIMDQGQIVADGPTSQIMADAGLLRAHGLEKPYTPALIAPGTP